MSKENLKETAQKNMEKGENFVWNLYKKFNEKIDKVLCEITGETEETKFGLKDLWKWWKEKTKKDNDKHLLEEDINTNKEEKK